MTVDNMSLLVALKQKPHPSDAGSEAVFDGKSGERRGKSEEFGARREERGGEEVRAGSEEGRARRGRGESEERRRL